MNSIYLQKVIELADDIVKNNIAFNRLGTSEDLQRGLRKAGVLAVAASIVSQRSGCSVSDAQFSEEAELERCIDQSSDIRELAQYMGCWYENQSAAESSLKKSGYSFYGYGGESRVFISDPVKDVIKITSISRSLSPQRFFDRLVIHNTFAPIAPLEVLGFTTVMNDDGVGLGVIMRQPFIEAKRELSVEEIASFMNELGFDENQDAIYKHSEFFNSEFIATDLGSNNVLVTPDNMIVIIDGDFEFNIPGFGWGGTFMYGSDEQIDLK